MNSDVVPLPQFFLDAAAAAASLCPGPFIIPWPMPRSPGGFVSFDEFGTWRSFVLELGLSSHVPEIVTAKFLRAQKLLLLAWVDSDLIKAAELVSLTALELALMDRYAPQVKKAYGRVNLAHLLRYMPEHDGLQDEMVGMIRRCKGGTVVGLLTGERLPKISQIRNTSAHGYPFDSWPQSGLIELVRDLIDYAFRGLRPTS